MGRRPRPRCRATDPLTWGANAIYDIVDKKLVHKGYYKMPAPQTDTENCVAHNGSLIPVPGRDLMVQSWYQGGISVFDFTDSANPVEIAFFDRGPINPKELVTGGYWSSYWYNGNIYGAEISRGIDVFRLLPSAFLSENEIAAANLVRFEEFNSQNQPRYVWPPSFVVAKAYLDQLVRGKTIDPARAKALATALDRGDTRCGRSGAGLSSSTRWPPTSKPMPRCPGRRRQALSGHGGGDQGAHRALALAASFGGVGRSFSSANAAALKSRPTWCPGRCHEVPGRRIALRTTANRFRASRRRAGSPRRGRARSTRADGHRQAARNPRMGRHAWRAASRPVPRAPPCPRSCRSRTAPGS